MEKENYPVTIFRFREFMEYDDGLIARLETTDDAIPVNVFADEGTDFDLQEGELCSVELMGIGSDLKIYENEEAFNDSGTGLAPVSMIPAGTFPANDDDEDFKQSPHIIFTGKAADVTVDPDAKPDEPDCCVTINTYKMVVSVILRYDGKIAPGYIIHGIAWLYGDIKRMAQIESGRHMPSDA